MVQTKFNSQRINNGNRFGGDKAWRQHRYDGDDSNVVGRNAVSQRFARREMVAEAQCPESDDFSGSPLEFFTPDGSVHVYLRYDRVGRLVSAHCG